MTENKPKPVRKLRSGGITMTIWQNTNDQNQVFHTMVIERSYKDKDDKWATTNSYRLIDLPKIAELARKVYSEFSITEDEQKTE